MVLPEQWPRGQDSSCLAAHLLSCPDPGHVTRCSRVHFFLNEVELLALKDSSSTQTVKSYAAKQLQWIMQGAVPETRVQASD